MRAIQAGDPPSLPALPATGGEKSHSEKGTGRSACRLRQPVSAPSEELLSWPDHPQSSGFEASVSAPQEIVTAAGSGQPVRVHTNDGEVLVARVLEYDEREFRYVVITSSRPERYGVCDSTGFTLPLESVERVALLSDAAPRKRRPRGKTPKL